MNISNLRESNHETKQEGSSDVSKIVPKSNLTTSSWSRLKDPRIVRVSRAFGGKDRHSKVCTVRGLRDRRVRLSVPTAIQLYDLQDRLGLNQPSKVVDWLLDAAKHEIDELPPLQIPPGSFGQNLQAMLSACSQSEEVKSNVNGLNWEDYWNPDRSKATARDTSEDGENLDPEDKRNKHDQHGTFVQSSNFFGRNPNSSNLPALPSIPSGSQVLLYPPPQPPPQTQSYFPSHNHNSGEFDPKQLNFQMLSSSSSSNFTPPLYTINQGMRPFHLSMSPKFFSSEDHGGHEPHK
ncbi:unnamed protein product [Lactuca saligna]|uniref:TCP domain-containing protein n=1 Tax=Lactuca saligna TaxID=75948 RepID=A0AA35YN54_LACSI|nr:unnamed protein product [Lactuca saligna]